MFWFSCFGMISYEIPNNSEEIANIAEKAQL